jgi:hypothetical protein
MKWLARSRLRGDILRATMTWACTNEKCAIGMIRLTVAEEIGHHKPLQWPLKCPRCLEPLGKYSGLEVGR